MTQMRTATAFLVLATFFLAPCTRADHAPFRVAGLLKDVFHDPTDAGYLFVYVQATNGTYYATLQKKIFDNIFEIESSVGAQVEVVGQLVGRGDLASRPYSAREIRISNPSGFNILCPPPADMFSFPGERSLQQLTPDVLSDQLFRCVRGKVLAAWNGDAVLVRTAKGDIIGAELKTPGLPQPDETVELSGLPETTLYNLRLNRALWRSIAPPEKGGDEQAMETTAERIVMDKQGNPRMDIALHGKALRIKGIVRSLPNAAAGNGILHLEDNGFIVPVNAEAAAAALGNLRIGCTVEATGVCVMDIDVWRPNAVFPRIRSYTLVTRRPADIRILAYPPWLTPQRMFVIVLILAAVLLGILVWTYALRVQSERRGRELAREQLLRAESDLKVHERTRLAVELHDALSQSLAGIALELKTVAALADANPALAKEHLGLADRSLLACRSDLRNCLYDLRSDALEEKTMDAAIRRTLAPHVDKTGVSVRFNVPRERISDNTAHAILCIIRELTLNAIRHGRATEIKVAGAFEDGKLLFSVRDNGCGFNPADRPDVRQGHFGLQGIRERVLAFNGNFKVESRPGAGTKATVAIGLPKEDAVHG